MMGEKELEVDVNENIQIDNIGIKGTLGLWRLIMTKRPEHLTPRKNEITRNW